MNSNQIDVAAVTLLVESAYGLEADIFSDVLRVGVAAPQAEVQQAFLDRRYELYNALHMDSEPSSSTARMLTHEERELVRKKIDALAASFKLLSHPILRKEYINSITSPKKLTALVSTVTPESIHPKNPTNQDDFDMIASRNFKGSSNTSKVLDSLDHDDIQKIDRIQESPDRLIQPSTHIIVGNVRDSSNVNTYDSTHRNGIFGSQVSTPNSRSSKPDQRRPLNARSESQAHAIKSNSSLGPSSNESIPSRLPTSQRTMPSQDSFDEIMETSIIKKEESFEEIMEGPSDEKHFQTKMMSILKQSIPTRGKVERNNKVKFDDDGTATTEYSEDLSYEPEKSKRAAVPVRSKEPSRTSKNENLYEDDEEEDEDDEEDEFAPVHRHRRLQSNDTMESDVISLDDSKSYILDDNIPLCNCAQEDIAGSISNTLSVLDQVLSVFSVSDKDMDGFSKAIHRAENDFKYAKAVYDDE